MPEGFFGRIVDKMFPPQPEQPKRCPHGYEGEKPFDCSECQGVAIPMFRRRLSEDERKEYFERLAELRSLITKESIRTAIENYEEKELAKKISDFDDYLRTLNESGMYEDLAGRLIALDSKVLGHDVASGDEAIGHYMWSVDQELNWYKENGEEEFAENQKNLEPFLQWKEDVERRKKDVADKKAGQ